MSLQSLTSALFSEIQKPANLRTFTQTKTRYAALCGFESAHAVIDHLRDDRFDYASKEPISRALLAASQCEPGSFWRSLMLLAYYPMLVNIRAQIRSSVSGEDLDQLVMQGFLQALAVVHGESEGDNTSLRLRCRTRRYVFRGLREAQESEVFDVAPEHMVANDNSAKPLSRKPAALASCLHEHFDEIGKADRELVFRTLVEDESLRELANADAQNDNADPDRVYARLRKRRFRALANMREVITKKCVPELSAWRLFLLYNANPVACPNEGDKQ